jgi:hypothetical protein
VAEKAKEVGKGKAAEVARDREMIGAEAARTIISSDATLTD